MVAGFRVGDLAVAVEGAGPVRARPGFEPGGEPALVLSQRVTDAALRPAGEPAVECDMWAAFPRAGGGLSLLSKMPIWSPPEVARVDLAPGGERGELLARPGLDADPLAYPLDQLLAIHLLHRRGGLLLHAACIARGGAAAIVAGPSGAGKTTISRAAAALPDVDILTDERVVVRRRGADWVADGTPWAGEGNFARDGTARLEAIYLLEQADRDEITPISPVRAIAGLLRCHFPPTWIADCEAAQLRALERLVAGVPCYTLRARLGGDAHRRVAPGRPANMLRSTHARGGMIAELLRAGRSARFTAFGSSMHPAVRSGDVVTAVPASEHELQIGDIALFDRGGQLVAHRVVARDPLRTRGDAIADCDPPVAPGAVVGKVVKVRRGWRRRFSERVRRRLRYDGR